MADNIELYVADITSNTDKLSAKVIHDGLVSFVRDEAITGEFILKTLVGSFSNIAGGDSMASKAGHIGPEDIGEEFEARVGIPEIHKVDESSPLSAKYPLFKEKGTGVFGPVGHEIFPKEKQFMRIPAERSYLGVPIYLKSSRGQPGAHFLAATFVEMVAMLRVNGEKMKAELTAKLEAEKIA